MRQDPNVTPTHRYLDALDSPDAVIVSRSASQQARDLRRVKAAEVAVYGAAAVTVITPLASLAVEGVSLTNMLSSTVPDLTPQAECLLFVLTAMFFVGLVVGVGAGWAGGRDRAKLKADGLLTHELHEAPVSLRTPMRAALGAADTIADSRAVRDGWLDDIDLDAALWDLAQHLKAGSRLRELLDNGGINAVDGQEARADLVAAVTYLQTSADRLIRIAFQVKAFDEELAAGPDLVHLDDYERLSRARTDLIVIDRVVDNTADRIMGKLDAYRELSGKENAN